MLFQLSFASRAFLEGVVGTLDFEEGVAEVYRGELEEIEVGERRAGQIDEATHFEVEEEVEVWHRKCLDVRMHARSAEEVGIFYLCRLSIVLSCRLMSPMLVIQC